ncbi:hypothetical protein KM043_015363 [Ampulex compressa]|nr:hypothetical protein KM043_015363 [Ampulex compressa]
MKHHLAEQMAMIATNNGHQFTARSKIREAMYAAVQRPVESPATLKAKLNEERKALRPENSYRNWSMTASCFLRLRKSASCRYAARTIAYRTRPSSLSAT